MDATDLARWQFAITTVYHFLFVPITIGMSAVVAGFHTAWVRHHDPRMYRLTRFFGTLFLINFALGLVTGIVQEFQFGMNWSDYSRFVGDIFGAPLAFEALLAFFLESVFLGIWIFGWGRIPEKLHAATMWLVHIGTVLSAYFILAANSFMQNPVGYKYNSQTQRAELTDFLAVLFNKVQLVTFPHVLTASYMTGGAMVMAVALWHLRRAHSVGAIDAVHADSDAATPADTSAQRVERVEHTDRVEQGGAHTADAAGTPRTARVGADREAYRRAARVGAIITLVASLGVVVTGDLQGKVMTEVQPMKMAAAEAHYETSSHAPFSVLSIGDLSGNNATHLIQVPGLLSYLGKGDFDAEIQGIDNLSTEYKAKYAGDPRTADPTGSYTPNIPTTYWTFRLMMGFGFVGIAMSLLALWATRKGAKSDVMAPKWWHWAIMATPFLPLLANSFGWIFTEMGRQPWLVNGLMATNAGVSPGVSAWEVGLSMVLFTLLYGVLAIVEVKLFCSYVKRGAEAFGEPFVHDPDDEDRPLVFSY